MNKDNKKPSSTATAEKTAKKSTTSTKKTAAKKPAVVKPKADAAENLRDFFLDGLKDIYWAEKALVKSLPKMAKNATSKKLIEAIESHLTETEEQVNRLKSVFESLGEKAVAKKCDAMDGLIKEGESIIKETKPGAVRDAGIIAASQKIEHYEIASYGTLVAHAKTLGEKESVKLLLKTLDEEKAADKTLSEAAYNDINFKAS